MAKDKFGQMKQTGSGSLSSFQDLATTVAAIENQAEKQPAQTVAAPSGGVGQSLSSSEVRYMRLPNPQIPLKEYNLISTYCTSFANMTRQDFVELALVEKLHNDGMMTDGDFSARSAEIKNRPPRGHRKGLRSSVSN